jgi:hypothetical protein
MPDHLNDTHADAEARQIEALRRLGPERRAALSARWSDEIREATMQGIRDRNPSYDERRVVLEYARITLGERLFREAFGEEADASP